MVIINTFIQLIIITLVIACSGFVFGMGFFTARSLFKKDS